MWDCKVKYEERLQNSKGPDTLHPTIIITRRKTKELVVLEMEEQLEQWENIKIKESPCFELYGGLVRKGTSKLDKALNFQKLVENVIKNNKNKHRLENFQHVIPPLSYNHFHEKR